MQASACCGTGGCVLAGEAARGQQRMCKDRRAVASREGVVSCGFLAFPFLPCRPARPLDTHWWHPATSTLSLCGKGCRPRPGCCSWFCVRGLHPLKESQHIRVVEIVFHSHAGQRHSQRHPPSCKVQVSAPKAGILMQPAQPPPLTPPHTPPPTLVQNPGASLQSQCPHAASAASP